MSNQTLDDSINAGFCGDNANIPRVFVAQFGGMPLQEFGECKPTTTTEVEGTDMTPINNVIIYLLETEVRESIRQSENFNPVLVQV